MIIKGNYRNILVVLPALFIMLFAAAIMFPVVSESTHAEGDVPEDGISITVSDSVSANVVLFDEGDYKIAKDTVHVSSSAPYGYELYLSTDSEEHQSIYLNNDPTSTSVISPVSGTIAEPAALTSNTWGFAIAGQGNFDNEYSTTSPDPNSRFAIIPTTNDQAVYENNSATADDDIDFYYGIKVEPTLEPGEYTTSASYTAIAKIPPLTAKAVLGENGNLNFLYDRNTYTPGDTYADNIGETEISAVYDVPVDSGYNNKPEWTSNNNILTANFESSFHNFTPTSVAYWFYYDMYLESMTNTNNLNTSQALSMRSMFNYAGYSSDSFDLNLSYWDTSNVTEMTSMFDCSGRRASIYKLNLSGWDVGNVKGLYHMFYRAGDLNASSWNIDGLGNWNPSSATNMSGMFEDAGTNAATFNLNLSGWKTGNVTNMSYMFSGAGRGAEDTFSLNLSGWDTSSVTDMSYLFQAAGNSATSWSINGLEGWNTSSVTDMQYMFYNAGYTAADFNLNLSGWKTGSVIYMNRMFANAGYGATRWTVGDLGNWNTGSVTNMSYMFYSAGYSASPSFSLNLSSWNTSNVKNMEFMFYYTGYTADNWTVGNLSNWNTGSVTNMSYMFHSAGYNADSWTVGDFNGWKTDNVTNVSYMFYNAGYTAADGTWDIGNLKYIDDDHKGWTVSQIKKDNHYRFTNSAQTNIDKTKLPW